MMDHFHHSGQVALFLKFSRLYIDQVKQLVGINQVKVAGQRQVTGWNGVPFYKWMTEFCIVLSLGAIAQVPQQQFTEK